MEMNAVKKTLQELLIQLITECNWNTKSPERHVSKIVVAAYWDGIPEAIRNEIKALGPDAEKYLQTRQRAQKFKTIAEELDHYETAEIRKAVDGILLDERTLKQAGIRFNTCNYSSLKTQGRIDLLPDFDTQFRGNIKALVNIPFTGSAKTIIHTEWNGRDAYFVGPAKKQDPFLPIAVEQFDQFEHAVAYCLSQSHYKAIVRLLGND
jgi:hypothetical protein